MRRLDLKLRSQTWRGIPWEHLLQLYLPQGASPDQALLYITGDTPAEGETYGFAMAAERLRAPVAVLFNVPNQPLFDDLREDALIALTFDQYLETGDESWPLLVPMVRSAVAAMDQVQEITRRELGEAAGSFVVTGASKRGWTTWLTALRDPRVRAIAPMVFDNLCFPRQMQRQHELWGDFSAEIDDYTERDLQAKMETERGQQLVRMMDPWFHRERLTLPKLLIHGANDPYWATDATGLYWDTLLGSKSLLTVPNSGHGLQDGQRVLGTLTAFFHQVRRGEALPELGVSHAQADGHAILRVRPTETAISVQCWAARAPNLDFRPCEWRAERIEGTDGEYAAEIPLPDTGGLALFAEVEFAGLEGLFTLSTPTVVYGSNPPQQAPEGG